MKLSASVSVSLLVFAFACSAPKTQPTEFVQAPLASTTASVADPAKADPPQVDASTTDAGLSASEVLASIREISPTEHAITMRAMTQILDDDREMLSQARLVPDPPGGTGIRIFGVRGDSLPARLGLQNGDRVESLMGRPTATVDQARAAYALLRGATSIPVEIERGAAKVHLLVHVE